MSITNSVSNNDIRSLQFNTDYLPAKSHDKQSLIMKIVLPIFLAIAAAATAFAILIVLGTVVLPLTLANIAFAVSGASFLTLGIIGEFSFYPSSIQDEDASLENAPILEIPEPSIPAAPEAPFLDLDFLAAEVEQNQVAINPASIVGSVHPIAIPRAIQPIRAPQPINTRPGIHELRSRIPQFEDDSSSDNDEPGSSGPSLSGSLASLSSREPVKRPPVKAVRPQDLVQACLANSGGVDPMFAAAMNRQQKITARQQQDMNASWASLGSSMIIEAAAS